MTHAATDPTRSTDVAPAAVGGRRTNALVVAGNGVSLLGDGMFAVAVAFAVFALGGGAFELGVLMLANLATIILTILPAGALADRWSRRRLVIGSDVVRLACQLANAALVWTQVGSVWWLLPTSVLFGLATAVHQPAVVGFTAEVVHEDDLVHVNSLTQATRGIGMVLGAAVGGALVELVGSHVVLAIDGLTFAACALCLGLVARPVRPAHVAGEAVVAPQAVRIRAGFELARREPWIASGMGLVSMFMLVMLGPMQVVGPEVARLSGDGASLWGLVSAVIATGIVCGAVAAMSGRARHPVAIVRVLLLVGATGHLALAAGVPIAWALPGYLCLGAAMGCFAANWEATKQREVPRATLSRIGALDWFVSASGMLTGVALAAVGVTVAGTGPVLVGMAMGAVMLAVATTRTQALTRMISATATAPRGAVAPAPGAASQPTCVAPAVPA